MDFSNAAGHNNLSLKGCARACRTCSIAKAKCIPRQGFPDAKCERYLDFVSYYYSVIVDNWCLKTDDPLSDVFAWKKTARFKPQRYGDENPQSQRMK